MSVPTGRQSPRSLVLTVLESVAAGSFLAPTLSSALDGSGLVGADRSMVTELAYGVARRQIALDAALAPYLKAPGRLPPRVTGALRVGAFELLVRGTPPHAAVSSWVEVVKREQPALAGLVNAVLRRLSRDRSAAADPATANSLPQWLWREFEGALGPHAAAAAAGMLEPEPLWLTALAPEAAASLRADGCEVRPGPLPEGLPTALAVRSPAPLASLAAYRDGLVQPQNPASLYAALALEAGPGESVFDLASGRGIKSAVLAAAGAEVTAVEIDPRRSAAATKNLARLGVKTRHVTADLRSGPPPELLRTPAARVLLDAPCSGTGTLRGNPEIKLRLTPDDVARFAADQRRMLAVAAELVAPGGVLLYAVCALTEAEGPLVAAGFLASQPGFEALPLACPLPHVRTEPAGLFVLSVDGLDGFYLARFRRN